ARLDVLAALKCSRQPSRLRKLRDLLRLFDDRGVRKQHDAVGDGNYGRCAAGRDHRGAGPWLFDLDGVTNAVSCEGGDLLEGPLRPANVNGQVLSFDIAAFAHTLAESIQHRGRRRRNREHSNAGLLNRRGRLLRAHRERPRDCRTANQGNELAPSHLLLQAQETLSRLMKNTSSTRSSLLSILCGPSKL